MTRRSNIFDEQELDIRRQKERVKEQETQLKKFERAKRDSLGRRIPEDNRIKGAKRGQTNVTVHPHGFWCSDDLWEAVHVKAKREQRTKRDIIETALSMYIYGEKRTLDGDK